MHAATRDTNYTTPVTLIAYAELQNLLKIDNNRNVIYDFSEWTSNRQTEPYVVLFNKVDVLHVRLTDLHAAHQNLPFPPNQILPLKQYQY